MKIDKNIDFKKYKRFFAFGCSFTNYCWPTWADYVGRNIGEYYNFGASGSGNMHILQQLVQANKKYKFSNTDLVIICWTNTTREDSYIDGGWRLTGNLESQGEGPWKNNNYVIDYRGMFMRDIGFITAASQILTNSPCDWDFMSMVNIAYYDTDWEHMKPKKPGLVPHAYHINDLKEFFAEELSSIKKSYFDILGGWDSFERAKYKNNGYITEDYHPTPKIHMEVVSKIYNLHNVNPEIVEYINKKDKELLSKTWESVKLLMEGPYNNETKSHNAAQWPVIW